MVVWHAEVCDEHLEGARQAVAGELHGHLFVGVSGLLRLVRIHGFDDPGSVRRLVYQLLEF